MPHNPRLQRTRSAPLRSPLSRNPFGDLAFSRAALLFVVSILVLAVCTPAGVAAAGPDLTNPADEAVATVLARLVKKYSSFGTVFLCVDLSDAPDLMADRVSQLTGVCVKPCHAHVDGPGRWDGILDPETGAHGVGIGVRAVKPVGENEYEMEGGYGCGPLCAAEFIYRVRRESSGWRIVSEAMQWIS